VARPVIPALKDLSPEALDWSKVSVFFTGEFLVRSAVRHSNHGCWRVFPGVGKCTVLGDFEHHFQVFVGDYIPNSWVMFK